MANSIIGKSINDDLYSIKFTEQNEIELLFVDFKYDMSEKDNTNGFIGPDIFTQKTKINEKRIEVEDDILKSLNDVLQSEFVKKAKIEGLKNREKSNIGNKFDLDFKKWETDLKKTGSDNIQLALIRRLFAKINNCSSYIASDGRIGPAQFVITNEKTHKLFEDFIGVGFMRYYVCNELEDCDIILGRKNDYTQPGIILIVNENNSMTSKRVFSEQDPYGEEDWGYDIKEISLTTIGDKKYVDLSYEFVSIGFFPEKQFYCIKIINNE